MNSYAKDLMDRAKKHDEAAMVIFDGPTFSDEEEKKRAVAIVAKVTANMMKVIAEWMAYQEGAANLTETDKRRKALMERSNEIRAAYTRAAETNDWKEYDELTKSWGGRSDTDSG